jgi:hypothetical protein
MTEYASIVDGDLLAFKAACHFENHGADHMEERLTQDLNLWDPGLGSQIVAFSCSRTENYRRDFWPAYKAHRDAKASPQYLRATIDWITEHYETVKYPRLEADDILGVYMSRYGSACVTKDKDLQSVPGLFWDPEKTGFPVVFSRLDAHRNFCEQWLKGDTADNIPGIHRCGAKAATKFLDERPPEEWVASILQYYCDIEYDTVKWKSKATGQQTSGTRGELLEDKYGWHGGHGEEYALSQARCVRILRDGEVDEDWNPILWTPGF